MELPFSFSSYESLNFWFTYPPSAFHCLILILYARWQISCIDRYTYPLALLLYFNQRYPLITMDAEDTATLTSLEQINSKIKVPFFLLVVMWSLGVIDWSPPKYEGIQDIFRRPLFGKYTSVCLFVCLNQQ